MFAAYCKGIGGAYVHPIGGLVFSIPHRTYFTAINKSISLHIVNRIISMCIWIVTSILCILSFTSI
jgi:hypothetical protein